MNQILEKKLVRIVRNINNRAKKYSQPNLSRADLIKKIEENSLICEYCRRRLRVYDDHRAYPDAVSIDHKLAMALGGSNDITNIAICCHECNDRKNWEEAQMANGRKIADCDSAAQAGIEWIG